MSYLRWLLLIPLLTLAYFRLSPHFVDFPKVLALSNQIRPVWIVLALASQAGQYIGDGWLAFVLLKIIGFRINMAETVKISSLNVFASNLLPLGEAGSVATVFYFYRKLGVDNQGIIFLSLAWTIITSLVLVVLFLISLLFLPQIPNLPHFPIVFVILSMLIPLIIFVIYKDQKYIWPRVRKYFSRFQIYVELSKFKNNISVYKQAVLKNKGQLLFALTGAAIYYGANIATLTFSFLAFGYNPHLSIIVCAYTLSLIAGIITLAPAGLGAAEATLLLIFLQFNFDPATSIAAILVFRLINFWIPIPTGAWAYFSLKHELARNVVKDF